MGAQAQKPELFVPHSKIKAEVARILKDEGYITDYELDRSAAHPRIKITNKLVNRSCAITGLRAGQPARSAALCWCAGNSARARWNGDRDSLNAAWCFVRAGSKKQNVGGKLLAYVW